MDHFTQLLIDEVLRFLFRQVIELITKVAPPDFADNVVHALYERAGRSGYWKAFRFGVRDLWSACKATLRIRRSHPFAAVDWEFALASSPGVDAAPLTREIPVLRGRKYFRFSGIQAAITRDPAARAGGYWMFPTSGALGYEKTSNLPVAALPLQCGGTAGALTVAVFVAASGNPQFVGVIQQGDKQGVFFVDGTLHVATPVRDADEPNCSWRRTRVARYSVGSHGIDKIDENVITTVRFNRIYGSAIKRQQRTANTPTA
ncbi:MAG: hypothetical protein KGN02_07610 [bacterium]|nr:hypothetical protein [bacterium]